MYKHFTWIDVVPMVHSDWNRNVKHLKLFNKFVVIEMAESLIDRNL